MMSERAISETVDLRPAKLDDTEIESIRRLEERMGGGVCLVAVKRQPLFVLEAKTGPNRWQCVRDVYPETGLTAYYPDIESSKLAKSSLKSLLLGKWKHRFKKYPIRIREVS